MSFPAAGCLYCEYRDVEKGLIQFSRDASSVMYIRKEMSLDS